MNAQTGRAWKRAAGVFGYSIAVLVLSVAPARGDMVSDWSAIAGHLAASARQDPARAARDLAVVRVAMFETMNFVEGKFVPRFLVKLAAPLGSSSEMEAAGAAHYVLTRLYPGHQVLLDAVLARSLAFSDRPTTSSARIWGKHLAGNVYALWPAPRPASAPMHAQLRQVSLSVGQSGVEAWDSKLMRFVAAKTLQPIEQARILALASLAASDVYSEVDSARRRGVFMPCVPCAVDAAVRVVLESEFGGEAGRPVKLGAESSGSGEMIGKRIGLQVLNYYKRIK